MRSSFCDAIIILKEIRKMGSVAVSRTALFVILLFFSFPAQANFFGSCLSIFGFTSGKAEQLVSEEVAVVYYLGDQVYNPNKGFNPSIKKARQKRVFKPHGVFWIKASPEEIFRLKEYVESSPKLDQNCVGGVCSALNKFTGITIPFPFNQVPALTAIYLILAKKMGYDAGRIEKIQFKKKEFLASWWAMYSGMTTVLTSLAVGVISMSVIDPLMTPKLVRNIEIPISLPQEYEKSLDLNEFRIAGTNKSNTIIVFSVKGATTRKVGMLASDVPAQEIADQESSLMPLEIESGVLWGTRNLTGQNKTEKIALADIGKNGEVLFRDGVKLHGFEYNLLQGSIA